MTLTIEITSPLAEKIIEAADRAGIPVAEHATRLLEGATERVDRETVDNRNATSDLSEIDAKCPDGERESKRLRGSAFGKYAYLPISSYDFAKEKQAEIDREDRRLR